MSTTNRAFIKAYRHDDPQSEPVGQPGGARGGGDPAHGTTDGPHVRDATKSAAIGGAIARGQVTSSLATSESRAATARSHTIGGAPIGERRPLSTFITRPQAVEEPVQKSIDTSRLDTFRPGTTVANFNWPAVCRTLLQQGGHQFDHVVRILKSRAAAGNSLIGVMGLFPKIGATTMALCLASRAASRGTRVMLIDGNFCTPSIAKQLEVTPTVGWEESLRHSAQLADAAIHATVDNLDILALGTRPALDPKPLVSNLQTAVTAGILRHAYDLVLMDIGTFFDPTSQPIVLELIGNMGVDAMVAIAGPHPADPRDINTINEYLDKNGCELLGVIENRIAKPHAA
jgi:Mrp family chromosome partitioning ATPase